MINRDQPTGGAECARPRRRSSTDLRMRRVSLPGRLPVGLIVYAATLGILATGLAATLPTSVEPLAGGRASVATPARTATPERDVLATLPAGGESAEAPEALLLDPEPAGAPAADAAP